MPLIFRLSSSALRALVSVSTAVSPVSSPGSTPGRGDEHTSPLYFRNIGSLTDAKDFQSSSSAPFTIHSPLLSVSFFMATTARQASLMVLK